MRHTLAASVSVCVLALCAQGTAVASPRSAACGFKHAVWSSVVGQTSYMISLDNRYTTDDVSHDRATVDQIYSDAENRYGYPYGYYALGADLGSAWSHTWDAAYWATLTLSAATFDERDWEMGKHNAAMGQAWTSMHYAWGDIKRICPGG